MRKTHPLQVEQIGGNKHPDLESAQLAALPSISESLQAVIRELLESGDLVLVDNKIIPSGKDEKV